MSGNQQRFRQRERANARAHAIDLAKRCPEVCALPVRETIRHLEALVTEGKGLHHHKAANWAAILAAEQAPRGFWRHEWICFVLASLERVRPTPEGAMVHRLYYGEFDHPHLYRVADGQRCDGVYPHKGGPCSVCGEVMAGDRVIEDDHEWAS